MLKLGSHVGMSGKEMLLGSAKEAVSYGANTFMFYTGAPQNTRRKEINELNIEPAWEYMKEHGIDEIVVHAPYIINLGNSVKPETFSLAVEFLAKEIDRTIACRSHTLILHPGAHVGAGIETGTAQIIKGLNEVLTADTDCCIALETMAGKGTECGVNIDELKNIIDLVTYKDKIGVCIDTCHLNDSGVDISRFDEYLDTFDSIIGIDKIKCVHVNDSKNEISSHKDRHENIGYGTIGFENLIKVIYNERLKDIPKILETPYVGDKKEYPPYKFEIKMIKNKKFNENLISDIIEYYKK